MGVGHPIPAPLSMEDQGFISKSLCTKFNPSLPYQIQNSPHSQRLENTPSEHNIYNPELN